MTNACDLSLVEMSELLACGDLCPVDLTEGVFERVQENEHLNAFVTLNKEGALRQAEESRQRLKKKQGSKQEKSQGVSLEGIPLAYKDMFCTKGLLTTAGSRMLENFVPPYSAHVVALLEKEGAVCIGKCNQDEFAMGSASITGFGGAVVSPLSDKAGKHLSAGGSSGGSAAAVAAGIVPAALGTDTGGSVRQPAAFTGCVGVKPTYGRCSRFGIVAYASSLDQAGLFARSVSDASAVLRHMIGFDERDMTSINFDGGEKVHSDMNIGVLLPSSEVVEKYPAISEWRKGMEMFIGKQSIEKNMIAGEHYTIKNMNLQNLESGALETYYIIATAEASSNLARYDGVRYTHRTTDLAENNIESLMSSSRSEGFGSEVRRRILMGTHVLSSGYYDAVYVQAQKMRRLVKEIFEKIFETYDIVLSPVTPTTAFSLEEATSFSPQAMYLQDFFTVPASLAGLPCLSMPLTKDANGLPIGLQLIAPAFQEERLFAAASHFENIIGYKP